MYKYYFLRYLKVLLSKFNLSLSEVLNRIVFSLEVSPFIIFIEVLGILKVFDKNSINHLLALPSTGGVVILILVISPSVIISFLDELGEILIFIIMPSGVCLIIK